MSRMHAAVFLLLLALCSSCRDETGLESDASHWGLAPQELARAVADAASDSRSSDEFFARINEVVPGFAGMLFEDGSPVVYLTDLTAAELTRSALADLLAERGKHPSAIVFRSADYPWGQLYEWRRDGRALFGVPGLTSLSISVTDNRITFGVESAAAEQLVLEGLGRIGIPPGAVLIQAEPHVELLSIRDKIRPVRGGTEISPGNCTIGFNVQWDTLRAFVTAAHCAYPVVGNDGDIFYQDTIGPGKRVGAEYLNPSYYACLPTGQSVQSNYCLDADVALVLYDDTVDWSYGHIARTMGSGQYSGSTAIDPQQSRWWITQEALPNQMLVGDTVHKLGYTTGWTFGAITNACKDVSAAQPSPFILYWLICQHEVDAGAAGGDSGSPVFQVLGAGKIAIGGVLWGGTSEGPIYYSSISRIEDALGGHIEAATSAPVAPYGVSLNGPTEIRPGATCTWTVSYSGGTIPVAYTWTNDSQVVGTTDTYTGSKLSGTTGTSFVLQIQVTNDAGAAYDQITVTETASAPICMM